MKYVTNTKVLLGALLTSTLVSGCSLTEFVTGKPEGLAATTNTAQTNTAQIDTIEPNTAEKNVEQTSVAPTSPAMQTTVIAAPPSTTSTPNQPSSTEHKAKQIQVDSEDEDVTAYTRVIKRLPAEKPRPSMSYYGSVSQPYRQVNTKPSSSEAYMPPLTQHSLTGAEHSVLVEEYIERVSTDLINSLASNLSDPVIGVTSFVDFNNNLTSVSPFGNRIAEHFISELQQSGFVVADYKVKDTITVNHNGDIVFSRNTSELGNVEGMTHVLAGTIMYQEKGLKIIARVVDFDNKWVVASASTFMPYFVLDSIVPSAAKHTVF